MVPSSWFLSTASFPWTGPGTKRGLVSDCGWCEHTLLRTRLSFHSPRQGPQALSTLCSLMPVPLSLWISRPGCAAADRLSLPRHAQVPGLGASTGPGTRCTHGSWNAPGTRCTHGSWDSVHPPVPGLGASHICWSLLSSFNASSPGVITQVPPSAPGTRKSAYPLLLILPNLFGSVQSLSHV